MNIRQEGAGVEPKCPDCVKSTVTTAISDAAPVFAAKIKNNCRKDPRGGVYVCTKCGLQIGERFIQEGSEWRDFGDSDNRDAPNRVGGRENPLLGDILSTSIGDGAGQLGKYQNRNTNPEQRALLSAFSKITTFGERLSLIKKVTSVAQEIYKKIYDTREFKGRKTDTLVATCLYIACKVEGVPRSLKEICKELGQKRRDVGRCYTKVTKLVKIKAPPKRDGDPRSAKFMVRFCNKLHLPPAVTKVCEEVARNAHAKGLCPGQTPAAVAAAAIFLVSDTSKVENAARSFLEIATVAHIAESTVRSTYKRLEPHKVELLPAAK